MAAKEEVITKERNQRFRKWVEEMMKDRLPSWYEAYDANGNRRYRANAWDKMRIAMLLQAQERLDSLSDEEFMRQWEERQQQMKDASPPLTLGGILAFIFDALIDSFRPEEENRDQPAQQSA